MTFTPVISYSQRVAISGDALKWATLSANVGVDVVLTRDISLNVEASYNPMKKFFIDDYSFHHISLSPEVRYWFKRPFYSHFVGVNMLMSSYDLVYKDKFRDGLVVAVGLGYGYSLMLSDRWNFVPSVGFGLGYVSYLTEAATSENTPKISGFKLIPTRLGVTFSYIIN